MVKGCFPGILLPWNGPPRKLSVRLAQERRQEGAGFSSPAGSDMGLKDRLLRKNIVVALIVVLTVMTCLSSAYGLPRTDIYTAHITLSKPKVWEEVPTPIPVDIEPSAYLDALGQPFVFDGLFAGGLAGDSHLFFPYI